MFACRVGARPFAAAGSATTALEVTGEVLYCPYPEIGP
jgi:hypothetical protein